MKYLILLLLLMPMMAFSQNIVIDPIYQDMSWIIDEKCGEIFTDLSAKYRNEKLLNDTNWVLEERYNLYYDSLSLWSLTKDGNDIYITGGDEFKHTEVERDVEKYLTLFDNTFNSYLQKHDYNTSLSNMCIPSNYEHIKYVKKYESDRVKDFNKGRIFSYNYVLSHHKTKVNVELYFHKSIMPYDTHGAKYSLTEGWVPFYYFYAAPKVKVYKANCKKIWESKTGLPYKLLKELNVDSNRITDILEYFELLPKETLNVNKIFVNCDTCDVKLYDSQVQDGDIVEFEYNEKEVIHLTKLGTIQQILLSNNSLFKLKGVSKGNIDLCTVDLLIENKKYTFSLGEGQEEYIELIKGY